jgi:hypothetical protein
MMGRLQEAQPLLSIAEREAIGQTPPDPDLPVTMIAKSRQAGND